jgi:carboxyl-terminal processing protease
VKKIIHMLPLVMTSVIWCAIGWVLHSYFMEQTNIAQQPTNKLIDQARTLIQTQQYVPNEVGEAQLTYGAIRGMLAQTHDPYAVLFTPPASEAYARDIAGEVGSPGLWFDHIDHKIVIVRIVPGRAAERAGLQVGDILVNVNDVEFDETTTRDEAAVLLRGPVGTTTKVVIQRGQARLEYEVTREELTLIASQVISNQIGYIFPLNAEQKLSQHLQALLDQHVQALIWDLRESRGGSLQATQAILNNFMTEGTVYIAEFKAGKRQTFTAEGGMQVVDLPLVVLINESTYSSSEMAALALATHDRAILIGSPTEGKGTIQDTVALDNQHLLRITIAKWLSPTGEWIEGHGVVPDITVTDDPATVTDEVLDFATHYIMQELLAK